MLKAIEFVSQADGRIGREIAKRSKNQNDFMKNVILFGQDQVFFDVMSKKYGEPILPVIAYSAVGGVYHQLKGFFAECLADGIVGSELPQEKEKAVRKPREPRKSVEPAPAKMRAHARGPASLAMEIRKVSKVAARVLIAEARARRNLPEEPDTAILTLARNFRAAGKEALALALEADYLADLARVQEARANARTEELRTILAALQARYGKDEVIDAVSAL